MGGDVRKRKRVLGSRVEGDVFLCVCLLFFQLLLPFLNRKNTMVAPLKQPNRNHLPPYDNSSGGRGSPPSKADERKKADGLHTSSPPSPPSPLLHDVRLGFLGGRTRRRSSTEDEEDEEGEITSPGSHLAKATRLTPGQLDFDPAFFFRKKLLPLRIGIGYAMPCLAEGKAWHSRCQCEVRRGVSRSPAQAQVPSGGKIFHFFSPSATIRRIDKIISPRFLFDLSRRRDQIATGCPLLASAMPCHALLCHALPSAWQGMASHGMSRRGGDDFDL